MMIRSTASVLFGAPALLLLPISPSSLLAQAALSGTSPPEAYLTWADQNGGNYTHSAFLGNDDKAAIHWKIEDDTIRIAVGAEASGWLGFGISQAGGMAGSDIVTYSADDNILVDSFALKDGRPEEDTCQDWTFVDSLVDSDFILFEATRKLITGDNQDHDITDDSDIATPAHPVIAAWGNDAGVSYHLDNTAKAYIRFFGSAAKEKSVEEAEDTATVEFRANSFLIPEDETLYQDFCYNVEDLEDQGYPQGNDTTLYMIEADFIEDPNTIEFVHHIILYASPDTPACESYFQVPIYLWAPGTDTFYLPKDVGIAFGKDGYKSFRMEVHYNNPKGLTGNTDNTAVRLTYTTTPRKHKAAVMVIGDPAVVLEGETIGDGVTKYDFKCPGACLEQHLPHEVTVFSEALHAHETGISIVNTQTRNGVDIRRGLIDYYDFAHNGGYLVKQDPFTVQAGDEFRTTCYYKEAGERKFGFGSADEMCMVFLYYYPAVETFHGMCGFGLSQVIPGDQACDNPDFGNVTLTDEDDIDRTFGTSPQDTCDQMPDGAIRKEEKEFPSGEQQQQPELASSTSDGVNIRSNPFLLLSLVGPMLALIQI